jgi:hypothetical protein
MNKADGLISSSELTGSRNLFRLTAVTRSGFFAALFFIARVKWARSDVVQSVIEKGFTQALLSTLNTSVCCHARMMCRHHTRISGPFRSHS